MRKLALLALFGSWLVIGCDGVGTPALVPEGSRPADPDRADEVAFDSVLHAPEVQSMFERARRAFRERDGVLRGGDATSGTEVSPAGISVTPYRWIDDTRSSEGAALHLGTSSVARGLQELTTGAAPSVRVTETGAARIDLGGAVEEEVRNTDGGFEQSWEFASAPAPAAGGDLVVRIAVAGQEYAGRTASGLHFVDPATGLGFSYSDATWIDAAGDRYPVAAEFDAGEGAIVLTVPDEVVEGAAYPALLDPTVAAEHGLDNPILGPAAQLQSVPSIAYSGVSGKEFLVVWSDSRREPGTISNDVFGARINASGVVLDPVGIHIPTTNVAGLQFEPDVAWGDDGPGGLPGHWLVVWTDENQVMTHIRGIHIDANGSPLGPDFSVTPPGTDVREFRPDIAFNPMSGGNTGRFLVVYRKSTGGLFATTVRPDSPAGGVELSTQLTSLPFVDHPSVAAGSPSTGFLVAWSNPFTGGSSIQCATVSATAVPGPVRTISSHPFTYDHDALGVGYAPDRGWLVVWQDGAQNSPIEGVFGQLVALDGVPTGQTFGISTGPFDYWDTTVTGGAGGRLLAVWGDNRPEATGLYGARIDIVGATATVVDPDGIPISTPGDKGSAAVAFNPPKGNFMIAWNDRRNSIVPDIYGGRVRASDGVVLDPNGRRLSGSFNEQTAPAIASCGGKYLAVWTDTRNGFDNPDIYGTLTDASTPVNILARNLRIAQAPGRQEFPDVACNGTDFFVVWSDRRVGFEADIYGTRVRGANGVVLDPAGIPISIAPGAQTRPAIAFLATSQTYQVVWAGRSDPANGNFDIFGKRISAAGVVDASSELNISGPVAGDQIVPDVTWDADFGGFFQNRFLVVWQDGRNRTSESDPNWDIFGRFVDVGGGLFATIPIQTLAGAQMAPSVATMPNLNLFVGRTHFVVYQSSSFGSFDIWGQIIFPGGSLGNLLQVAATSSPDEVEPTVANRTADQMLVTYGRAPFGETFNFDVYGRDIDVNPLAAVGGPFLVSAAPQVFTHDVREHAPVPACASASSCQVLYQRYSDKEQPGSPAVDAPGVDRVRGRMLTY